MKNLNVAKLRQALLSKIEHNYSIDEIEKALDAFVDAIIEATEKEITDKQIKP